MKRSTLLLSVLILILGSGLVACNAPLRLVVLSTPTPSATSTPSPSPTLTQTTTPTPSPTPMPAQRLEFGETDLFTGDYEAARREYEQALAAASDDETRAAAAVGIARTYFHQRDYPAAVNQFKAVIDAYPSASASAEAWYFLGESYSILQAYPEAADAFARYLQLRPQPLAGYIQSQRGDLLLAAGDGAGAAEAFTAALDSPPPGDPVWLRLKLARAYSLQEDYTAAVTLFLDIYASTTNDYAKAQANLLLGQIYLSLGQSEQAYNRFADSVENFPASYDTYSGLVELVNAAQPVSELDRGIVDYYAGQYWYCVEALNRYIDSGQASDASPYYFRGLCLRATDQIELALADFTRIIDNYPDDFYWARSYDEKAYTLWAYLERYDEAADLLLSYVARAPAAADAPEELFEAARIYERAGKLEQAAGTWEQLVSIYPAYQRSLQGLIFAGVSYYRMGDTARALTAFQRALILTDDPETQSTAYLWIGKTHQASGDDASARAAWEAGVQKDPTGYYSERAAELLSGGSPFTLQNPFNLGYDLNAERAEAENWLRQTFSLPPETDLSGLGDLASEPAFLRGEELYNLGRYAEARDEFETLRQANISDPAATYRLMNFYLQRSFYRPAILSSRQILDLSGMDDAGTLRAPRYFNHIRFGIYYRDLVLAAAENENLNPLFIFSVIRQESLFESIAASGAGARGLMQIVPATGQELAEQLAWPPGYSSADLDRPVVSITFGARYLSRQLAYFDGSLFAALAAYNGGPGNTIIWNDLAGGDPDLLLEVIRAEETRHYIRQIYEFFNLYRLIYEQKP